MIPKQMTGRLIIESLWLLYLNKPINSLKKKISFCFCYWTTTGSTVMNTSNGVWGIIQGNQTCGP